MPSREGEPRLTSREWEVLELMRRKMTTAQIARTLVVSPATVRSHVAAILRKLRVPDRDAAVRLFEDPAGLTAPRAASSPRATSTARRGPGSRRRGRGAGSRSPGSGRRARRRRGRRGAPSSACSSAAMNARRDRLAGALEEAVGDLDARGAVAQRGERVDEPLGRVVALDARRRARRPRAGRTCSRRSARRRRPRRAITSRKPVHERAAAAGLERERERRLAADAARGGEPRAQR